MTAFFLFQILRVYSAVRTEYLNIIQVNFIMYAVSGGHLLGKEYIILILLQFLSDTPR
jgi:hypothetical protein